MSKLNTPTTDKEGGKKPFDEFTKTISEILGEYPLLKWKSKKNHNLAIKLYREGASAKDAAGIIMLNS